jgi:hypothetical protein
VVAAALLFVAYSIYADVDASECECQIQNPTRKP